MSKKTRKIYTKIHIVLQSYTSLIAKNLLVIQSKIFYTFIHNHLVLPLDEPELPEDPNDPNYPENPDNPNTHLILLRTVRTGGRD